MADRFEDTPQERLEKERCSFRHQRAYYLGCEDWHQTAFSIVCDWVAGLGVSALALCERQTGETVLYMSST